MASSVAGHRRAFGLDTVPGLYEDLEGVDTVVLVGSNRAWCPAVLFQRLAAAREARGTRVVVIDPRRTATCDIADLHLPLAPGSDAVPFALLLSDIERRGLIIKTPDCVSETVGRSPRHPARHRPAAQRTAAVHGSVVRQRTGGDCLLPGHQPVRQRHRQGERDPEVPAGDRPIGRAGMGPFSVTGQPDAMGGREVGGLSNMRACRRNIANPARRDAVDGLWRARRRPILAEVTSPKAAPSCGCRSRTAWRRACPFRRCTGRVNLRPAASICWLRG